MTVVLFIAANTNGDSSVRVSYEDKNAVAVMAPVSAEQTNSPSTDTKAHAGTFWDYLESAISRVLGIE